MDAQKIQILAPHVLILPIPLQSPINCMLKLAELLCIAGLHVTFLNINHFHTRLLRHNDVESRFARYPKFRFQTISDGLPEDHPRCGEQFYEMMNAMENVVQPLLRDMLKNKGNLPITCIISEANIGFALGIADEFKIPLMLFDTISPCAVWTYICLPKLIEAGHVPFKGNDLDESIKCVSGMESFLRQRDLPHFCRADDISDPGIQQTLTEGQQLPLAHGLILNTFEHLDHLIISQIRTICPNIYAIGPLHLHYKSRLVTSATNSSQQISWSNSLWREDKSCITWLNAQPPKSVLYVSIGSHVPMTQDQRMELWHGLVNSKTRFLWIIRPGSIIGEVTDRDHDVPEELLEGTKEMGFIASWAPQEEVLAHQAIGGFFTHSGWGSTLESMVEGVPMICWPCYVDQQVTSRYVSEVWKLGLDMKDRCDRVIIEKMVRDVMNVRREEFMKSADEIAKSASESVSEDGSSYCHLDRLIEDIRLLSRQAHEPDEISVLN